MITTTQTYDIHITGLVQGVGFRPFIYRLAVARNLKGWVENRNDGVKIRISCTEAECVNFIEDIRNNAPLASSIYSIDYRVCIPAKFKDFRIVPSSNLSDEITEISPDIAVCHACLHDMKHQVHRINFPFINCTNCGPRFTIIRDLPYDRNKTTMAPFDMCQVCEQEYMDVLDRRFHAQPVACNRCGPRYELLEGEQRLSDLTKIIGRVCHLLEHGRIVAIKGLGGFFIACDATDGQAVSRLRSGKRREGKPFAVMFSSIEAVREYALVSQEEERLLLSWRRPIVLLEERKKLAPGVSVGFPSIGAMLPYMPFHHLLFEKLKLKVIVLTSGNLSDEPILIDNNRSIEQLNNVTDAILIYNRDIYNRADDSVTMVVNGRERLLRRSRGFVPSPVRMQMQVDGIFAAGAELVNCFCIGKGSLAIPSQHIGDLQNAETLAFYTEAVERFSRIFRFNPALVATDMHPDYLSTRFADALGYPLVKVQHHHAHIASVMAEHGLDEQVIGVAFDGVGYGDDGNIWGGEFLLCDLDNYHRYTHFDYIPMPGGDRATEEPWRMAISYLYKNYSRDLLNLDIPLLRCPEIPHDKLEWVIAAIDKKINSPLTSSAGRLFDAVSALTGLCTHSVFHAEAPMRLEAVADRQTKERYEFSAGKTIGFEPMISGIVQDITHNVSLSIISAKFHNTVIESALQTIHKMHTETGIRKIVLSGGSFQNRYMLSRMEEQLQRKDYQVFINSQVPANDGGIALGQLAVAARRNVP